MIITIKRIRMKGEAIDGHLYIDGMKICDCAENAKSCLSVGSYHVVRHKCKQYARFVPLVVNDQLQTDLAHKCHHCKRKGYVSCNTCFPVSCPQIKMGNGIYNRQDGSIIVGTYIVPGCMMWSKEPFENLCERLRKLDDRGSEVTLVIEENYPAPHENSLTPYRIGTKVLDQIGYPSNI